MSSSFEEFVLSWNRDFPKAWGKYSGNPAKHLKHLLFLVTYPDKLKWDFAVEKQTQTTTLMLSGGDTGASYGHYIKFCRQSKVNETLKKETDCTHAMICSVGWVANYHHKHPRRKYFPLYDHSISTPITYFTEEFSKSDMYCKGHILARPNTNASLHNQHIELNLVKWRELGCPNVYGKWSNYTRSHENYHDDYTPYWIIPEGLPRIDNFSRPEREKKAFGYPHMRDYNEVWKDFTKADPKDFYFSRFLPRIKKTFYVYNTETYFEIPWPTDGLFDVYFAPTAGYLTEDYCYINKFKGDVVFYDYNQENVDIKRKIVEMNMSYDEIKLLFNYETSYPINYGDINKYKKDHIDYGVNNKRVAAENIKTFHSDLQKKQEYMYQNCNIEYWLMDLIKPDYDKIIKKIKGKKVFFRASNIFSYHMSHAHYTIDELFDSFFELMDVLKQADGCWFSGTIPTKERGRFWV